MNFIDYLNQFNTDDKRMTFHQIRTNICVDELKISEEEKAFVKNEVNEMLSKMSYAEVNEMIESWLSEPYGTDVDAYRISLLDDAIVNYHNEYLSQNLRKDTDKVDLMFKKSYQMAQRSSKCL